MKTKQITALLLGLFIAATASANLLVSNTCDSLTGWSLGEFPSGSLSITNNFGGSGNTGNALVRPLVDGNNQYAVLGLGQDVTLGNNDWLELSVDYRFTGTPPTDNFSMIFGFVGDAADALAQTAINLGVTDGGNNSKFSQGAPGDNGGKFEGINAGTTDHTLVFKFQMDATSSNVIFEVWNDGTSLGSSTKAIELTSTTFDSLRLGGTSLGAGVDTQILYDNVVATTSVPEPATIGMLGLAGVVVTALRRLRR